MHVLLIGSGGREHALAWKLSQSPLVTELTCAPGNAGIARIADCATLDIEDGGAVAAFADEECIDLVIIGPEAPLVAGVADVLAEAARVVRPGGLVLLNTFNSTPLAWLLAVHGFKFVVRDAPEHIHVFDLFIAPSVLTEMADDAGLAMEIIRGVRPALGKPFWWSLRHRRIHPDFAFRFTASPAVGYMGCAVRQHRAGDS